MKKGLEVLSLLLILFLISGCNQSVQSTIKSSNNSAASQVNTPTNTIKPYVSAESTIVPDTTGSKVITYPLLSPDVMGDNIAENISTPNSSFEQDNKSTGKKEIEIEPIYLTYNVDKDNKKLTFSMNSIKLKKGQQIIVNKEKNIDGDTILGGDFFKILDIERKYSKESDSSIYYFKGMSDGKTIIEFKYSNNSQIVGQLFVEVVSSNEEYSNPEAPIYVKYEIINIEKKKVIEFSQNEVVLEVGQKLLLVPEDNSQDYQIMRTKFSFDELSINEIYQIGNNQRVFLVKAINTGKVSMGFNVAHAATINGSIDVIIKSK